MSESSQVDSMALAFLAATQQDDGGWGYVAGMRSGIEPTAAATIILQRDGAYAAAHERGVKYLLNAQHGDGGWGMSAADPDGGWQTAWALLALRAVPEIQEPLARAADWLVGVESWEPEAADLKMDAREMLTVDPTIYGWPWMPGEATWVEPTALALLALADIPQEPAAAERVQRALRFLVERRCLDGGWNVGNPTMLGTNLPPRAHPTAWALLALARLAPDAITEEDLMALRREMQRDGGALALAWGTLALRTVGVSHEEPRAQLATMQSLDGSWNGNPYHTAVAAMALHESPGGLFPS